MIQYFKLKVWQSDMSQRLSMINETVNFIDRTLRLLHFLDKLCSGNFPSRASLLAEILKSFPAWKVSVRWLEPTIAQSWLDDYVERTEEGLQHVLPPADQPGEGPGLQAAGGHLGLPLHHSLRPGALQAGAQ